MCRPRILKSKFMKYNFPVPGPRRTVRLALVVTYGNERSPKRQKLPLSLSFSISLIRSSEYLDMTSFLLYDYFSIFVCLPRGLWINKFELPPGLLQGINFILRTNDKNSAWKQSDRTTDGTNTHPNDVKPNRVKCSKWIIHKTLLTIALLIKWGSIVQFWSHRTNWRSVITRHNNTHDDYYSLFLYIKRYTFAQ